ncbi:hypothetical protein ACJX0J_034056, partial [Zea mays]
LLALLPTLRLLLLHHPRPNGGGCLHAFNPARRTWLRLPFAQFLPYQSFSPIASSTSLLYLWVETSSSTSPLALPPSTSSASSASPVHPPKSLAVCNPFSDTYRLLPQLGSAWACHDTVLTGPAGTVLIRTELAALSYTPSRSAKWMKHPLSLPSKPRSPILASDAVFALCDVGTPWRSQWKLFSCPLAILTGGCAPVERAVWGDVFEVLKRPRLLARAGGRRVLMIGGLRSSFAMAGTRRGAGGRRMRRPPPVHRSYAAAPASSCVAAPSLLLCLCPLQAEETRELRTINKWGEMMYEKIKKLDKELARYVHNNIFFSFAVDSDYEDISKDHKPDCQNGSSRSTKVSSPDVITKPDANHGKSAEVVDSKSEEAQLTDREQATYASTNNDLKGTKAYQEADVSGLHNLAMAIVDYRGHRVVAQSIIPGILQGDKSDSLLYGSVDNGKKISWNETFHSKVVEAAKQLHLKEHVVLDGSGNPVKLAATVECKGIVGSDD